MSFDDAQKKELAALIAEQLKASLTAEVLGPVVGAALAPALKPVTDAQAALAAELTKVKETAAKPPENPGKPADPAKPGAQLDERTRTEIEALKQQIAQQQAQTEQERKARLESEKARKTEVLHTRVRDLLGKAGVPSDRMHLAMPVLRELGAFQEDGDGFVWKGTVNGVTGVHSLEAGISEWMKGDGTSFLPPKPVAGTGDKAPMSAPTTKDGKVDWSALNESFRSGKVNMSALAGAD